MATDRHALEESLLEVDFPAGKEDLVEHARNNGADESTIHALRAMPPAEYANLTEVERSVWLDKGAEEGQSDSEKAQQDRQDTGSGLAEHQTRTPNNPIVEELGENRGS
ncbi:hypothetical protein FHX42_003106 [Saccharopolyspora lacisalsi]|uniref:DUF2795 domain-containing protein n=1 Tax=Halosaccharopolyspora lacisalsi TaxID=1000566 RepID=A0A839DXZ2_9PSEU|nr:DUF2795 domain-containing protein [Halosaccharopolyspora lacisalsi]MBA8825740.1 hypothetical protein [Halosaccharopolyspora lacisalsi]